MIRISAMRILLIVLLFILQSCIAPPPYAQNKRQPNGQSLNIARQRVSAIIVSRDKKVPEWIRERFAKNLAPKDAELGTAAPITNDGYFLTANHIVSNSTGKTIHLLYGRGADLQYAPSRIVWRDDRSDLAIIKAPFLTPKYYIFSPANHAIPEGTIIFHGGMTTGMTSKFGRTSDPLPTQHALSSAQKFRIDIPLQPGDSGGPILDADARLIGINSSVEYLIPMETPIFTESNGVRPNIRQVQQIIQRDRASH